VADLNVHVRTSIYAIYSASRDPGALLTRWCETTRPISSNDPADALMGDADALATPALLSIAPWLAWLQPPTRRASAWTPLHTVARAVVDAWHGYRATLDRPRLELAFQTLRMDLAEMDMRVSEQGGVGSVLGVGTARTLRGADVDNDAYTTGVVRRAYAAAEQICNTLRIPPDPRWSAKRDALGPPLAAPQTTSNALAETPEGNRDALVLLHPSAMDLYAGVGDLGTIARVMDDNAVALADQIASSVDLEVPELTFSAIAALAADARRLKSFEDACARSDQAFGAFMDRASECGHPAWGFAAAGLARMATCVLSTVTFGFLNMRFQGHVTRDGYHIVPAKLLPSPPVLVLPGRWYVVKHAVTRAPGDRVELLVQNARASTDATDTVNTGP